MAVESGVESDVQERPVVVLRLGEQHLGGLHAVAVHVLIELSPGMRVDRLAQVLRDRVQGMGQRAKTELAVEVGAFDLHRPLELIPQRR